MCDRLVCLSAGQVLVTGTPPEVVGDPRVAADYLGTDTRAVARSGAPGGGNDHAIRPVG
jgi:hypothetical protein